VTRRTEELNAALAELSKVNQRLEDISRIDGLTGVMNRRYFDETYAKEWSNAVRGHSHIAVLLLDLDLFKDINDTYGHLCGDEVLRRVAQTITTCLTRATDTVARYGGEEFIVLLPHTTQAGAERVAEIIRKKVESLRMFCQDNEVAAQKLRVQVSIGVATTVPTLGDESMVLVGNADQALYEAKNKGRNRIVVYSN
jgi:diguanylate cyclase (GGDEF)-like protein